MNEFIGPKNNIHIFAEPLITNHLRQIITTSKDEGRVEGLLLGVILGIILTTLFMEVIH